MLKKQFFLLWTLLSVFQLEAQTGNCTFDQPLVTIRFGAGDVADQNSTSLFNYRRVPGSCPTDGHYVYTSYSSDCFRKDWHTLPEDHTPGDAEGNMMVVNASPGSGTFFLTAANGLKSGAIYEFAVWMMNVCKISEKCPFPLLPDITIRLQTTAGKIITQLSIGELARRETPYWTQYRALFTMPASETAVILNMIDNNPGGCGNDFALDDITFRECIKHTPAAKTRPAVKTAPKAKTPPKAPAVVKRPSPEVKPTVKKRTPTPVKKQPAAPVKRPPQLAKIEKPTNDTPVLTPPVVRRRPPAFPAPPPALRTRANPLVKQIVTVAGQIRVDLYDNGEIDGDTVSIYHNNILLVSRAKLSEKPISFHIAVDAANPHHELVMVANNLGSIPPNTSLMVVTAGDNRYEVFISSTRQKNAKVAVDLKE